MDKFKLGAKVKDKVSGIEGIAVARAEFINGCVKYVVQPPVDKDGKWVEDRWFDEESLEQIGEGIEMKSKPTGGPNEGYRSSQTGKPKL